MTPHRRLWCCVVKPHMNFQLSPQSIDALADIISGGGGHDTTPPIGIYRSGPKIEKFMRGCNVAFTVDGSRVSSLVQCLINRGKVAFQLRMGEY